MHERLLRKGNGGYRGIVAPNKEEKRYLRLLLIKYINDIKLHPAAHGCRPERNPVTNGLVHIGYDLSICMDFSNFFDTVTRTQLDGKVPEWILKKCLYKGICAQGLPTSPALANIGARDFDYELEAWLISTEYDAVFTRYVDDVTVSLNKCSDEMIEEVKANVERIANNHGFSLNPKKTIVQFSSGGRRRNICGVSVGPTDVRATKRHRRKLRGLKHYENYTDELDHHIKGMTEWCSMKHPRSKLIRKI